MKIGHFETNLRWPGGISSYIAQLTAAQRARGHDVTHFEIGAPRNGANTGQLFRIQDTRELYELALTLKLDVLHTHTTLDHLPPEPLVVVRTVHTHAPYCPSGARYLRNSDVPCSRRYSRVGCSVMHLTEHCGSLRPAEYLREFGSRSRESGVLSHVPSIAVSDFVRSEMIRNGIPRALTRTLHNFAPEAAEPPRIADVATPRLLFLGRVERVKGVHRLLIALPRLRSPFVLDVVGDGGYRPRAQEQAEALGLGDRVRFHGWLKSEEVAQLLAVSRAVVMPSVWHEPAGMVALEAMAAARPVVAYSVGGIPEYVDDGKSGLLVDVRNPDGLSEALDVVCSDVELARRLGYQGRRVAMTRFSLMGHVDALDEIYTELMQQHCSNQTPAP